MKILLVIAFNLLLYNISFGQKDFRSGYIIQTGDTIKGLVNYRSAQRNAISCQFKTISDGPETVFKPTELTGYGFTQGPTYKSQLVPVGETMKKVPQFLKVLVQGTATLYSYRDSTDADKFFFEKGPTLHILEEKIRYESAKNGSKVKIVDQPFKKVLANSFNDCPFLTNEINETTLKVNSLVKLLVKYNNCLPSHQLTYVQKTVKSQFSWGLTAGINTSKLKIVGDIYLQTPEEYTSAVNPQIGFFLNFTLPKINEKLSAQIDGLVTKNNYNAQFSETVSFGRLNNYKVNFDLIYLKIPVQLRYTYPKGKLRPYLNAGFLNSLCINYNQESVKNSTFNNSSYTESSEPIKDFRKYNQGLTCGLGLLHTKTKLPFALELRYETSNGFSKAAAIQTRINTMYLLLSVHL